MKRLWTCLHFTHKFWNKNFPFCCFTTAQKNHDRVQTLISTFIYLNFNHLTFSMSSTRPEAGDTRERDGAQDPPLVAQSHAADRTAG